MLTPSLARTRIALGTIGASEYRWQARQDLNPQPAVLETAALPIELRAYVSDVSLPGFPMLSLPAATRAKLHERQPVGVISPVLLCVVIPLPAFVTRKRD